MGAAAALVVELDALLQPSHIYLHLTWLQQFPQLHVTSSWNPDARRSGVRDFLYAAWTMFLEFDWMKINSKNNLMMTRAGLSGKKTIINSIQSVTFTSFAKMWLCHCTMQPSIAIGSWNFFESNCLVCAHFWSKWDKIFLTGVKP